MMTRKNCEAIAAAIKALKAEQSHNAKTGAVSVSSIAYDKGFEDALNTIASNLCDVFDSDNPNFDHSRFLKAAGAL